MSDPAQGLFANAATESAPRSTWRRRAGDLVFTLLFLCLALPLYALYGYALYLFFRFTRV